MDLVGQFVWIFLSNSIHLNIFISLYIATYISISIHFTDVKLGADVSNNQPHDC